MNEPTTASLPFNVMATHLGGQASLAPLGAIYAA